MNQNIRIRCFLLIMIGIIVAGCREQSENGRFQIHSGIQDAVIVNTVDANLTTAIESKHVILKLDTQTGKTWIYFENALITTGGVTRMVGWSETTNSSKLIPASSPERN